MSVNDSRWDFPTSRLKAKEVRIQLQQAEISPWYPDEMSVTFALGGETYYGWMPKYAVEVDQKWLKAFIVGDFDNGDWEIFIPDETLQSTEFLRVPGQDQGTIVVEGWW